MQPTSKLDQGVTLKAILDKEPIPQDQKYQLWESYANATDPDAFFQQIGSSGLSKAAKYQVYYMKYPERIGQAKNAAAYLAAIPELDAYVQSVANRRELSTSTESSQPAAALRPTPDVKAAAPPKPPGTRPTPALPPGAQQPPGLGGMPLPGVPSPIVEMKTEQPGAAPEAILGLGGPAAGVGGALRNILSGASAPQTTVSASMGSAIPPAPETGGPMLKPNYGQSSVVEWFPGVRAWWNQRGVDPNRSALSREGTQTWRTMAAAPLVQLSPEVPVSTPMQGVAAGVFDAATGLLSPENMMLIGGMKALRGPAILPSAGRTVANVAFPAMMGEAAVEGAKVSVDPTQPLPQRIRAGTSAAISAGLAAKSAAHIKQGFNPDGRRADTRPLRQFAPEPQTYTPEPPPPKGARGLGEGRTIDVEAEVVGTEPLTQWQGPVVAPSAPPPRPPRVKTKKGGPNGQVKTETQTAPETLLVSPQSPVSANAETPVFGAAPAVPPPVPPPAEPGAAALDSEINGQVPGAVGAVGDLWQQVRNEDPKNVIPMDPMQIAADPLRFQFKSGMGEGGAGEDLRGLKAYDREKGGVLTVWTDPADGQTYIVNGHHRLDLAKRTKTPRVDVRYLQVDTAEEARAAGALQNIAEGNGTALDAAKVFRDLGATPADIDALGVTIKGTKKLAYNGLGLAQLGPEAFRLAVNEAISPEVGALIGYEVKGPDQQMRVAEFLVGRGHGASESHARTAIELAKGSKTEVVNQAELTGQDNLFGDIMVEDSDFGERVDVVTAIKEQLRSDKRLFTAVAKQGASETLQRKGNVIAGEENQAEANQLKQITGLFDRLYPVAGPVNNIIGEAAQRVKNGEPLARVVREVYPAVREAVEVAAGLRPRVGGSVQPVAGDGVQRPVEGEVAPVEGQPPAAPSEGVAPPQPPGVEPVAFDQTAIGEQGRLVNDAEIAAAETAAQRDAAAPLSRLFNTQIGARANDLDRSPLFTGELVQEDAPPQQASLLGEPPPKPPAGLQNALEGKPAAAPEPRPEPDVQVFTPREQDEKVDKPAREFASTQIDLVPEAADQIRLLSDRIAEEDLAGDGRELDPHVTLLFGLKETPKTKAVQKALKGVGSIEFQLGKVSVFPAAENGGKFDVVKIEVTSPSLHAANKALRDAFEYENNHPEYKPHVTLAYVKPGAGAKYAGMETGLEGQTFTADSITISGKDRSKTEVSLTKGAGKKVVAEKPQPPEAAAAPVENPKVEVQDAQKQEPPRKPSSTPSKPPVFRDPDLNDEQRESMTNIAAKRAAEAKAKFEAMRNRRGGQAMAKEGLPAEEVDLIADMAVPLMVERGLDADLWWPQLQADLGDWISDHELPILKAAVKKYQALKQSVLAAPPKPPKEKTDGDKKVGTEDAAGDRGSGVEQGGGQPVAVQSGGAGSRLDAETSAIQEEVVSSLQEKGVVSLGKSTKGRIVPRMITVGNPPTVDTSNVPKPKTYELKDVQAQSVAGAINAIDNLDGGYLIASGTGSGKSAIGSALARHYIDQGKAVVILAPAEVLKFKKPTQAMPEGSYKVWFEQYGLEPNRLMKDTQVEPGKLYVGTYHGDLLAATQFNKDTVVLFDESHALKNAGSKRTNDGIRLAEEAGGVVFMTATPADKPEHIQYLQRIGILEGGSVKDAMARLGMEEVEVDYKDPKTGRRRHYFYWAAKEKPAEIRKRFHELFDRMIETGRMRKDEIALDHLEMGVHQMEMPQECHDVLDMIEGEFFNEFGMPDGTMPPLRNAQMLGHLRRTQETFKIPQMVEMAKQEIAAGRKVIFFVSRVNWSPVGFNRIIGYEGPPGDQSPIYEYVQLYESDGTAKLLHKALVESGIGEDRIGHIHGKPKKSPQEILEAAKRAEDPDSPEAALAALNDDGGELDTDAIRSMDKFQAGNLDVLIATASSGGTGINLDDTAGDFPRTVIVGTPEFDAVNNIQLMGRVYRLSTRSAPKIVYLFGDTSVDQWNARILSEKFATLHSVAKGEVGKIGSAIYYDNSQSGPRLIKGGEVFTASQTLSGRRSGDTVIFWDNDAELVGKILGAPVYSTAKGKKMIGIDVDQMPVAQKKMNAEEIRLEYGDSNEPTAWLKDNRPEYVVRFDAEGNLVKQTAAARPAWGKRYGNEVVLFGEQARTIGNEFGLPVEQTPRGKDMVRVHVDDLEKIKASLGIEVEHSPAAPGDWRPRWQSPLKRIGNQPPKPPLANLKGAPPPKPSPRNAKSEPPRPPNWKMEDGASEDFSKYTLSQVAFRTQSRASTQNPQERLYVNRAGVELIRRAMESMGEPFPAASETDGFTKSADGWHKVAAEIHKLLPSHWMSGNGRQLANALADLPSIGFPYVINATKNTGTEPGFKFVLGAVRHESIHAGTLPLKSLLDLDALRRTNPDLSSRLQQFADRFSQYARIAPDNLVHEAVAYLAATPFAGDEGWMRAFGLTQDQGVELLTDILDEATALHGEKVHDVIDRIRKTVRDRVREGLQNRRLRGGGASRDRAGDADVQGPLAAAEGTAGTNPEDRETSPQPGTRSALAESRQPGAQPVLPVKGSPPPKPPQLNAKYPSSFAENKGYDEQPLDELPIERMAPAADFRADGDTVYLNGEAAQIFAHAQVALKDKSSAIRHTYGMALHTGFANQVARVVRKFADRHGADNLRDLADALASAKVVVNVPAHQGGATIEQTVRHERAHVALFVEDESAELFDYEAAEEHDFVLKTLADKVRESKAMQAAYGTGLRRRVNDYTLYHEIIGHFAGGQLDRLGLTQEEAGVLAGRVLAWYSYEHGEDIYGRLAGILGEEQFEALDAKSKAKMAGVRQRAGSLAGTPPPRPPGSDRHSGEAVPGRRPDLPRGAAAAGAVGRGDRQNGGGVSPAVVEFKRDLRGGAQSKLVRASDGKHYVVKHPNNPQGKRILANEWIATKLAQELGLPVQNVVAMDYDGKGWERTISSRTTTLEPAKVIGIEWWGDPDKDSTYDTLPDTLLANHPNLGEQLVRALPFDKWVGNADAREAVFRFINGKPEMRLIDQGYAMSGPYWDWADPPTSGMYFRPRVYDSVTSIESFRPELDAIKRMKPARIREIVMSTPTEWVDPDPEAARMKLDRMATDLIQRRSIVEGLIRDTASLRSRPFINWNAPVRPPLASAKATSGSERVRVSGESYHWLNQAAMRSLHRPLPNATAWIFGDDEVRKMTRWLREQKSMEARTLADALGKGYITVENGQFVSSAPPPPPTKSDKMRSLVRQLDEVGLLPSHVAMMKTGDKMPEHLKSVINFMMKQRHRLIAGEMTPRDVAKAYIMTLMSMGSDSISASLVEQSSGFEIDPEFYEEGTAKVRPEEAAAAWLLSPAGKRALDHIESGKYDPADFDELLRIRDAYGRNSLRNWAMQPSSKDVKALDSIADVTKAINEAKGETEKIESALKTLRGISTGKTGFMGHLLGFGALPTLDSVAVNFWLTGEGDIRYLDTLRARLARDLKESKGLDDPWVSGHLRDRIKKLMAPYFERIPADPDIMPHIAHHWIWGAAKGVRTTHAGVMRAQTMANLPPLAPPFYSALARAIEQKMPNYATPEQVRAIMSNPANGVKQDEVKWTGIEDWLAKSNGKVAKSDVLRYLSENAVTVQEIERNTLFDDLRKERDEVSKEIEKKVRSIFDSTPEKLPSWFMERVNSSGGSLRDALQALEYFAHGFTAEHKAKADEFRDLGLGDLLDQYLDLDKNVSRAAEGKNPMPHKYSRYTHPGGKRYRELLFTLPTKPSIPDESDTVKMGGNGAPTWIWEGDNPPPRVDYQSTHWSEPNVLAHVRFDERDGGKTLFIHEIQSDWHQAGREKGYKEKPAPPRRKMTESEMREFNRLLKEDDYFGFDNAAQARSAILDHDDWRDRWFTDNQRLIDLAEIYRNDIEYWRYDTTPDANRVPQAPFSKSWHEMVLRRMLRYAAENGFERLSWATGSMNTGLFAEDLRNRVTRLAWSISVPRDTIDGSPELVLEAQTNPRAPYMQVIGTFDPETGDALEQIGVDGDYPNLAEVVGKSIAEKILNGGDSGTIEGDDLTIGGEGMKGFYDKILPEYAAKYVKKWGASVEKVMMKIGDHTEKVWSIPITDEMRHSVITKGQPLFNLKGAPPPKPPR